MRSESRMHVVLAIICVIFGGLLFFAPASQAAGEPALGRVLYSHASNLRGMPVAESEIILRGDVLTTSEEGSALVELKSGAKVNITKNSSVRFWGDGGTVQAQLLAGAVVSASAGKPSMVVTTPKYTFAPAQEGACRYVVQLSKEQATVAGAMEGNLLVRASNAGGSYILHEGNYAAISASASGVPGQAAEAGGQAPAQRAGTVSNVIPDDVVQRKGQGAETFLKVNDAINWEDVVRTLQRGRLRIALLDGSSLNIGARSTMKIIKHDPRMQRTQIELTVGEMRARVVDLVQDYSSFKLQTPTAALGVVGTDFIVQANADLTAVFCLEGTVSVQNSDPAIAGKVVLHAGEYTSVARGQPPAAPVSTPNTVLQSQINQTTVGPEAGGPGGPAQAAKAGWHIGPLSEAASIGLLGGIAAAGAAIGIAAGHGSSSAATPIASPTAP